LRDRRDRPALAQLETSLGDLLTGWSLTAAETPPWVGATLRAFWDIHADPAAVLPDDAASSVLDDWIASLLADNGITGTVFVRTHLPEPPWLECRLREPDWLSRVRRATADPWRFPSHSLDTVVVVSEEERYFHAHIGRRS
jgi:hypothetical protein